MEEKVGQSNLPPNALNAFKELDVCDRSCVSNNECDRLHICPQFLYSGSCQYASYGSPDCRFGHDLRSSHNLSVLRGRGLEDLSFEDLRDKLKLMKKNLAIIPVCEEYAKGNSHEMEHCPALHICPDYLFTSCDDPRHLRDDPCHLRDGPYYLSHDLLGENCPTVLQHYGVQITKENVDSLRDDFRRLQTRRQPVISRFLFDYKNKVLIGSGGFGYVFSVEHIIDKNKYAVKCINFSGMAEADAVMREVEIIAKLHHKNIVRYCTCWIEDKMNFDCYEQDYGTSERFESLGISRVLVMEPQEGSIEQKCLCIQMELCHYEDEEGCASVKTFKNIMFKCDKYELPLMDLFSQLADAIAYMHSKDIMHRDLKPDNILLGRDEGYVLKIADFGLAKPTNSSGREHRMHTKNVGTERYMSPEMLRNEKYDKSTDIYSLGLLALGMFYPLKTECEWTDVLKETRRQCCPCSPTNCENYPMFSAVRSLLTNMLKDDPNERPSAKKVSNAVEQLM